MTVNQETTHEPTAQEPTADIVAGPGRRLRLAREAAGLSREEVATRLRLRLELIRALEDDDYAHLPPVAFVSGYLRSYARLLDLPAEELLTLLERRDEAPALVSPVMPSHQRRSSDWPVRVMTWLLVLLLLGLLIAWWFARQPQEQALVADQVPTMQPGGAVELVLPPASETPPQEEPVVAESPAVVVETAAPAVVVPSQAEIQLEASGGDCWLEIKDAAGTQVAYELLKDGTTRTVRGRAPFEVFLGYAPAVTVYYLGQVFDHRAFHRRDVAKFRLGKAADNKPITE